MHRTSRTIVGRVNSVTAKSDWQRVVTMHRDEGQDSGPSTNSQYILSSTTCIGTYISVVSFHVLPSYAITKRSDSP